MAGEDTENVGGIGISATVDLSALPEQLQQLLAQMEAAAKELSAALTIRPTITPGSAQQSTSVRFGANARGAATAADYAAFEQSIKKATDREDQALGVIATNISDTRQDAFDQVEEVARGEDVTPRINDLEFDQRTENMVGRFRGDMAAMEKAAIITPTLTTPAVEPVHDEDLAQAPVVTTAAPVRETPVVAAAESPAPTRRRPAEPLPATPPAPTTQTLLAPIAPAIRATRVPAPTPEPTAAPVQAVAAAPEQRTVAPVAPTAEPLAGAVAPRLDTAEFRDELDRLTSDFGAAIEQMQATGTVTPRLGAATQAVATPTATTATPAQPVEAESVVVAARTAEVAAPEVAPAVVQSTRAARRTAQTVPVEQGVAEAPAAETVTPTTPAQVVEPATVVPAAPARRTSRQRIVPAAAEQATRTNTPAVESVAAPSSVPTQTAPAGETQRAVAIPAEERAAAVPENVPAVEPAPTVEPAQPVAAVRRSRRAALPVAAYVEMPAEETPETPQRQVSTPVAAVGGAGGGGRRRTSVPAGEPEEPEQPDYGPPIRYVREAGQPSPVTAVRIQPLPKAVISPEQRAAERQAQAELRQNAVAGAQAAAVASKAELQAMSREVETQHSEGASRARNAAAYVEAPVQAPEDREALRARQKAERVQFEEQERSTRAREREAELDALGTTGRGGRTALGRVTAEDIERRSVEQVGASLATRVSAPRTPRTAAAGLGGFIPFLGQQRQLTQAIADQRSAEQKLAVDRRRLHDPAIIADARAYAQAEEEVTATENELARATERVQKFSTGTSAIRSLAAVSVAGAAFGIGMKVVDVAINAAQASLGSFIDEQTGFGATSTRVTSALALQTQALHGNVQAVLANREAEAGLSATAADYLDTQLKLTTQVKAGAIAQGQASELFRAAAGVQGQAPQGLFGGYGGIGGSALLGQQLGGGKGFTEQIAGDLQALSIRQQANPAANIPSGIQYVTNKDFRNYINEQGSAQGNVPQNVVGAISEIPGGIGDTLTNVADLFSSLAPNSPDFLNPIGATDRRTNQNKETAAAAAVASNPNQPVVNAYLQSLNSEIQRGTAGGGPQSNAQYVQTADKNIRDLGIAAASANQDVAGVSLAMQGFVLEVNGAAASAKEYKDAVTAAAIGASRIDPAVLAKQFQFVQPSITAAAERQQQFALGTQQPAQYALSVAAAPPTPVGTGIVAANSTEQRKITEYERSAVSEQKTLNQLYESGREVLTETYQIPEGLLGSIENLGKQIASTQAGISNEQAAYSTAQYNFQLSIARRTLGDIAGLTGHNFGVQQSQVGVLERQNLQLSRQSQQLSFQSTALGLQLSQRQINFSVATAGFNVPGLTPAEQEARIQEAKIEASYAQKQLDIQKQQAVIARTEFRNQVQIVDINNLRQGFDLANQIGLLLQGRQVQIDTKLADQKLERLQKHQAVLVQQAGTYLTKVDSLAAAAFSEIQQLEAAAGHAIAGVANDVLRQFGLVLRGLTAQLNAASGGTASQQGGGGTGATSTKAGRNAAGTVFTTNRQTNMTVGEAGPESVAVLRAPQKFGGGGMFMASDVTVGQAGGESVAIARNPQAVTEHAQGAVFNQSVSHSTNAPTTYAQGGSFTNTSAPTSIDSTVNAPHAYSMGGMFTNAPQTYASGGMFSMSTDARRTMNYAMDGYPAQAVSGPQSTVNSPITYATGGLFDQRAPHVTGYASGGSFSTHEQGGETNISNANLYASGGSFVVGGTAVPLAPQREFATGGTLTNPTVAQSQSTPPLQGYVAGGLFQTKAPTLVGPNAIAGEAGSEFVTVLRNAHPITGLGGGGGGVTVNINGPISIGSRDDLDELTTLLTRKVASAMGRDAQLRGLRPIGNS